LKGAVPIAEVFPTVGVIANISNSAMIAALRIQGVVVEGSVEFF
jgi:hypothetical protein